ncbi:hypothetical protein JT31_01935 [Cedecea neteri]|uniref:Uncharacterized protein n=1 Tax=Cedecea neteri TaxID=158822 RepID=A0A089PSX7_9ENTR|nr:hypothetical protein JT31_01935 [Cedecea neteri]
MKSYLLRIQPVVRTFIEASLKSTRGILNLFNFKRSTVDNHITSLDIGAYYAKLVSLAVKNNYFFDAHTNLL